MAECIENVDSESKNNTNNSSVDKICPVCLQPFIHPSRLPCNHIFCFLCIKGVVNKNNRCPMCRQSIPLDYLDDPVLLIDQNALKDSNKDSTQHFWYYEGRNGFWQYDLRTSQELEEAFMKKEKTCTILVAGYLYVVDFDKMYQFRQSDTARQRKVKRDLASIPKKGVAGIRMSMSSSEENDSRPVAQICVSDSNEELPRENVNLDLDGNNHSISSIPPRRHPVSMPNGEHLADIFGSLVLHDNSAMPIDESSAAEE